MSNVPETTKERMDREWEEFKVEVTKMVETFDHTTLQFYQTLEKLKSAVNPYGLPYGYGDKR